MVTHALIPVLKRLKQEDLKFEFNLGYVVRTCLKKRKKRCLEIAMLSSVFPPS
jgi:hypothetical protein